VDAGNPGFLGDHANSLGERIILSAETLLNLGQERLECGHLLVGVRLGARVIELHQKRSFNAQQHNCSNSPLRRIPQTASQHVAMTDKIEKNDKIAAAREAMDGLSMCIFVIS
jgi:hypothetical protein